MITLTVSGVPSAAATVWCENALEILDALGLHAEKLPFRFPLEAARAMRTLVAEWRTAAAQGPAFDWTDEFEPAEFQPLVVYWFNITRLTDDDRARLGITFTPDDGRAFADAVAAAVAEAMLESPPLAKLVDRLASAWEDCQPGFTDAVVSARPGL